MRRILAFPFWLCMITAFVLFLAFGAVAVFVEGE
jgi:hypothetical protein